MQDDLFSGSVGLVPMGMLVDLGNRINDIGSKLNGTNTIIDTLFEDFIDGHDRVKCSQEILARYKRFVNLMEMLNDYQIALDGLQKECAKLIDDMRGESH